MCVVCARYNKLGLDHRGDGDSGICRVTEVHQLTRVATEPLSSLWVASAAIGHTHSAVVTGQSVLISSLAVSLSPVDDI